MLFFLHLNWLCWSIALLTVVKTVNIVMVTSAYYKYCGKSVGDFLNDKVDLVSLC